MIERYYMAIDPDTTGPPAPGFIRYLILTSGNLSGHCSQGTENAYTASNAATISPGMALFLDDQLSVPVTGYTFVSDPMVGTIYNLNSTTGVVGSNTGQSC
jgi:hypothetical protein